MFFTDDVLCVNLRCCCLSSIISSGLCFCTRMAELCEVSQVVELKRSH